MKKLYRNDYDKVIAGVCSGIAEYFAIDKSLVRIVTVFLGFVLFWAILPTYIIAWMILPIKNY
ncbi:PspC domain-containing protein [Mollicutes bacterium LVI A0078]|nr:PspC domain-containing protein [Mollicutes bacterium LVI A0075]WOO90243.1 PspC domain-containing protein [Mollicutes bacterium LVI A0078]